MISTAILSAVLSQIAVADVPKMKTFPVPTGRAAEAREFLTAESKTPKADGRNAAERAAEMNSTFKQALLKLAPESLAAERLLTALKESSAADAAPAAVATLEKAASEVHDMLSFEPLAEAQLPDGVPTYTRVGTIEVKQYPTYRMAVGGTFFTLFRHIKSNNIAMTAPVQMEYAKEESGPLRQESMAFLYGSAAIGEVGKQGRVTVMDASPTTVVSAGVRGLRSKKVLAETADRLERWIEANSDYEAAGPVRVMGYNSPFVLATRQYFEVQIPIRKASGRGSP